MKINSVEEMMDAVKAIGAFTKSQNGIMMFQFVNTDNGKGLCAASLQDECDAAFLVSLFVQHILEPEGKGDQTSKFLRQIADTFEGYNVIRTMQDSDIKVDMDELIRQIKEMKDDD